MHEKKFSCSLFRHFDGFLDCGIAVTSMAQMLTELFVNGAELCLQVREDQVEKIFKIFRKCQAEGQVELLITLQAIVKVRSIYQ